MVQKLGFCCPVCNKLIEKPEFMVLAKIEPLSEKEKEEILSVLIASPVSKQITKEKSGIKVLYYFCSQEHKEEYVKPATSNGVKYIEAKNRREFKHHLKK